MDSYKSTVKLCFITFVAIHVEHPVRYKKKITGINGQTLDLCIKYLGEKKPHAYLGIFRDVTYLLLLHV